MSRLAATALLLCKCLVWTCPAYCFEAAPRLTTEAESVQPSSGHEHHHSDAGPAAPTAGSVAAALTGEHCADCAPMERAVLTARAGFSSNLVARTIPPGTGHIGQPLTIDTTPPSTIIGHPGASPPPGISPLRI